MTAKGRSSGLSITLFYRGWAKLTGASRQVVTKLVLQCTRVSQSLLDADLASDVAYGNRKSRKHCWDCRCIANEGVPTSRDHRYTALRSALTSYCVFSPAYEFAPHPPFRAALNAEFVLLLRVQRNQDKLRVHGASAHLHPFSYEQSSPGQPDHMNQSL
jgi:hypothetical protein